MKRRHFIAELRDGNKVIGMAEKFAWNAAIRASEALVRDHAHGETFIGDLPTVQGRAPDGIYHRTWRGSRSGRVLHVKMEEVYS